MVAGLADILGLPAAFLVLIVLPVAGIGALLIGGPDRVAVAAT
jgi:hypothetical protein